MKRLAAVCLSVALALSGLFALCSCSNPLYDKYEDLVFSYSMPFSAKLSGGDTKAAFDEMLALMDEINRDININNIIDKNFESNILKLNRAPAGERVPVGVHSYRLIVEAKKAYAKHGAEKIFNIASYSLSYLWGIDAVSFNDRNFPSGPNPKKIPPSFEGNATITSVDKPSAQQRDAAKALCDLDGLSVYEEDGEYYAIKQTAGLMVDLGGIAKGYAVDLCVEICRKHNVESAVIDLAGNILSYGNYKESRKKERNVTFVVNMPVPYGLGGFLCAFEVDGDNYAVNTAVTSGDYERTRIAHNNDGKQIEICHIIDCQTAMPYNLTMVSGDYINKDDNVVSCTVISQNSMWADIYATVGCILGLERAVEFFTAEGLKAIILTKDKRMAVMGDIQFTHTDEAGGFKEYTLYVG